VADWSITSVEVSGGFLAGLSIELPPGLTCIIGPRGSGKSTFAEAVRYTLLGADGATKARTDFIQATLRNSLITVKTAPDLNAKSYIVRRQFQQPPAITTMEGRPITDIDLDRGTFLPFDAYGTAEIELIADESLGEKRRVLLDELISAKLHQIQFTLGDYRRKLDANADSIRSADRTIAEIKERIEEIGDARGRLGALPPAPPGAETAVLSQASQQQQINEREMQAIDRSIESLSAWRRDINTMLDTYRKAFTAPCTVESSANAATTTAIDGMLAASVERVTAHLAEADREITSTQIGVSSEQAKLREVHGRQKASYDQLHSSNAVAGQAVRERALREQEVTKLVAFQKQQEEVVQARGVLYKERETLKASYLLEREQISRLRSSTASELQKHTGSKVRIRVLENADQLNYRHILTEGLRGARVRNHEDILSQLLCLRPEHLAQLIRDNDLDEFEAQTSLGKERSSKILEAYRSLDAFALETVIIDDQIKIELNVSPHGDPHFKDAAELSRGQKCTALLPLLLARRPTPLIIDQPEDNLDNHFIYETIVESVRRLKSSRQMVFITHNANIPVLGEADLVVVMNSDGKRGYIEKTGSLDECRSEIIDLLEGGEEAFELRRKRYATKP
jgi:energy-coupling factor transporter ATP-binding protein EcfA2